MTYKTTPHYSSVLFSFYSLAHSILATLASFVPLTQCFSTFFIIVPIRGKKEVPFWVFFSYAPLHENLMSWIYYVCLFTISIYALYIKRVILFSILQ